MTMATIGQEYESSSSSSQFASYTGSYIKLHQDESESSHYTSRLPSSSHTTNANTTNKESFEEKCINDNISASLEYSTSCAASLSSSVISSMISSTMISSSRREVKNNMPIILPYTSLSFPTTTTTSSSSIICNRQSSIYDSFFLATDLSLSQRYNNTTSIIHTDYPPPALLPAPAPAHHGAPTNNKINSRTITYLPYSYATTMINEATSINVTSAHTSNHSNYSYYSSRDITSISDHSNIISYNDECDDVVSIDKIINTQNNENKYMKKKEELKIESKTKYTHPCFIKQAIHHTSTLQDMSDLTIRSASSSSSSPKMISDVHSAHTTFYSNDSGHFIHEISHDSSCIFTQLKHSTRLDDDDYYDDDSSLLPLNNFIDHYDGYVYHDSVFHQIQHASVVSLSSNDDDNDHVRTIDHDTMTRNHDENSRYFQDNFQTTSFNKMTINMDEANLMKSIYTREDPILLNLIDSESISDLDLSLSFENERQNDGFNSMPINNMDETNAIKSTWDPTVLSVVSHNTLSDLDLSVSFDSEKQSDDDEDSNWDDLSLDEESGWRSDDLSISCDSFDHDIRTISSLDRIHNASRELEGCSIPYSLDESIIEEKDHRIRPAQPVTPNSNEVPKESNASSQLNGNDIPGRPLREIDTHGPEPHHSSPLTSEFINNTTFSIRQSPQLSIDRNDTNIISDNDSVVPVDAPLHIMKTWHSNTNVQNEVSYDIDITLNGTSSSPIRSKITKERSNASRTNTRMALPIPGFPTSILCKLRKFVRIPSTHPYKMKWDVCTIILTYLCAYQTHISIKNRNYEMSPFFILTQIWFLMDIILNFLTEHREQTIKDRYNDATTEPPTSSVSQKSSRRLSSSCCVGGSCYLTTWFLIDLLSLLPWERVYIKPIIDMQNKRNLLTKILLRTKVALRLSGKLRTKHIRIIKCLIKITKKIGVGGDLLVKWCIKYAPKYVLYVRNMRVVILVKGLRQIHFTMKVVRGLMDSSSHIHLDDGQGFSGIDRGVNRTF